MNLKEIKVCLVGVNIAALGIFNPHGSSLCLKKCITCLDIFIGIGFVWCAKSSHFFPTLK